MMNEGISAADAVLLGQNRDGFGDGGWWIWAFLIFAMFGWGGNGFGFGGNNGALTEAQLCNGFNFNNLESGIRGISNGICDSTFALNNAINNTNIAMLQGFNGVQSGVANLGYQLQNCCCEINRGIDGVNYNLVSQECLTRETLNNNTRDILENNNANTRAILDFLTQDKISSLQTELSLAQGQLSQVSQTNNIINALRPTAVPAYITCSPYVSSYGLGLNNYGGCGNGCGCGCGYGV